MLARCMALLTTANRPSLRYHRAYTTTLQAATLPRHLGANPPVPYPRTLTTFCSSLNFSSPTHIPAHRGPTQIAAAMSTTAMDPTAADPEQQQPQNNDVQDTVALTPTEQEIFSTLLAAVKHSGATTVLRCAGGWVRDKLLGKGSDDIDIALDNMLGKDFAELVNDYLKAQVGRGGWRLVAGG